MNTSLTPADAEAANKFITHIVAQSRDKKGSVYDIPDGLSYAATTEVIRFLREDLGYTVTRSYNTLQVVP